MVLHLNKIEFPSPKDALEKKIFKFCQCIFGISYSFPVEKGGALYLNKLESPSLKDALCQDWLESSQWFWRRKLLNFVKVFLLLYNYLSFRLDPSFNQIWNLITQECFVPSLVESGEMVLEKKIFEFRQCNFAILLIISPWKETGPFIWSLESPSLKDSLCKVWLKLVNWFWRRFL